MLFVYVTYTIEMLLENVAFSKAEHLIFLCVISGFQHKADENCALLGYYAPSSSNFLPTFGDVQGVENPK